MSDFCKWVTACEPALPWKPGQFLTAYRRKLEDANTDLAEDDSVASAMVDWADANLRVGASKDMVAKDLLIQLNYVMADTPKDMRHWPASPGALETTDNTGHRWQEGHPRYGGRKKRTAQMARDLAESMGVDPLEFMLSIIKNDVMDQTVIQDGKQKRVKVSVPLEIRMDAAKTVAGYMYPRLSAQQITGADDGPLAVATLDVSAILANPELAKAAQEIALMMVEQETAQDRLERGLPEPRLIDMPEYK